MPPLGLYLLLAMVFLSGCAEEKVLYPRYSPAIWSNYFQLQDIKTGMTKQDVISQMGPPRVEERGKKWRQRFILPNT